MDPSAIVEYQTALSPFLANNEVGNLLKESVKGYESGEYGQRVAERTKENKNEE